MDYVLSGGATRPSDYGEGSRRIESRIMQPKGEYRFGKRVNRLQMKDQIEPIFESGYKEGRHNHYYGKITIIKEVKENGEVRKVEKEISIMIDFKPNRSCFLYTKDKEDLEAAHRKVCEALSGR